MIFSNIIINNYLQQDFKTQELPLARIKKIMKMDEEVKVGIFLNLYNSTVSVLRH